MSRFNDSYDSYKKNQMWLIDNCQDGVYVSDLDTYEVLYVNKTCRQLLDLDETADVSGMKCYKLMQNLDQPCPFCTNHLIKETSYYAWEHFNPVFKRNSLLRDCLIRWDGKLCRLEIVLDTTTPEQKGQAIRRKVHIENTLFDCIGTMVSSSASDSAQSIVDILKAIGSYYKADRAYILGLNEKSGILHLSHEWVQKGVHRDDSGTYIEIRQSKRFTEAYENRHPYLIRDVEELRLNDPFDYNRQILRGVRSSYGVPLLVDDIVQGYICLDNPELNVGNYTLLKTLGTFVSNRLYQFRFNQKQEYEICHDAMTGLLNRNSYVRFMKSMHVKKPQSLGVVYANINRLGKLNTDLGMAYGDRVVMRVARNLQHIFGKHKVFRFHGDEFIVIVENCTYDTFVCLLEKLKHAVETATPSGVSVGHAWDDDHTCDLDQLIYKANQNMIVNKRIYMEQIHTRSKYANVKILEALKRELAMGRYVPYLQPKVDIHTEQLVGMEALVRYQSKEGVVTPGKFIAAFEHEGIVRHVDFFMLEQVCRMLVSWRAKHYRMYPVSVNFSRVTMMENNVITKIAHIVDTYDIPHENILIEITESAGELGRENFVALGTALQKQGFGVSLDDFCSEYSCVSLLPALSFTEVKFDRSMVSRIEHDEKMRFLCESMMEASNRLHCPVLAEGVETKAQVDMLKNFKCDIIQGYYYSQPIPIAQFEQKYIMN